MQCSESFPELYTFPLGIKAERIHHVNIKKRLCKCFRTIPQRKIHPRRIPNGVVHVVLDITMVEEDLEEEEEATTKEEQDYVVNSVRNLDTL
ncbi:hypothetical protein VNO77_33872 [Canavalia gladiata]|uniref:Uncharacterized protein n=1 Tax=Canavalia gladiata TaxID=3824 RepID=A0AAN9PYS0_CANGL